MKVYSRILAIGMIFFISCSTIKKIDPFMRSKEEIYKNIKTIALAPIIIPQDIPHKKQVKEYFESRLKTMLETLGFKVITSDKFDKVYQSMTKSMGGLYDSMTGSFNKEKHDAVLKHALRQMGAAYKADGVIFSSIIVLPIDFAGSIARWDGASDEVGAYGYSGRCSALSLAIELVDVLNNSYYYNRGGIQLISKIDGMSGEFYNVPLRQLLTDSKKNYHSIYLTLVPLDEVIPRR